MVMPLDGIKILELNRVAPGSFCGMMLGDMGAEIIKIDTPVRDGGKKSQGPKADPLWLLSEFTNRNKKSLTLNLKKPEAQKVLHGLIKNTDVLIEGFRPGVTTRLGADYQTLRTINSRLIYCSLSGFGQTGPYKYRAGHDLNYLAISGLLSQIGKPCQPPPIPLNVVADYAGATMHGVAGILLALIARSSTGCGQQVDIAYLDSAFALLSAVPGIRNYFVGSKEPRRGDNVFSGDYAYYCVYQTSDNKWITVGCMEPWLWENFCDALNRPDFKNAKMRTEDFENPASDRAKEVKREIEKIIGKKTREEWIALFEEHDVCVGEVNDFSEAISDPQLSSRQMVLDLGDQRVEGGKQPGVAIKLSETPGKIRGRPPEIGEHTDSILNSLGYTMTECKKFREIGAI
ncbi:MAG: CaiB/BaiF CoA-transferase family protein [Pseudomonadota bacterium]|nr:CaiB/BaiF CoA-transferase family protein [Pseudomonadota bacterium]